MPILSLIGLTAASIIGGGSATAADRLQQARKRRDAKEQREADNLRLRLQARADQAKARLLKQETKLAKKTKHPKQPKGRGHR